MATSEMSKVGIPFTHVAPSAGAGRYLPIARSTTQQAARHFPWFAHCRAVGTDKAIRPAKPPDILTTRRFAAKPRVELLKRPRVINPGHGMSWAFHPPTLSLASTCVKGIPTMSNMPLLAILQMQIERGRRRLETGTVGAALHASISGIVTAQLRKIYGDSLNIPSEFKISEGMPPTTDAERKRLVQSQVDKMNNMITYFD